MVNSTKMSLVKIQTYCVLDSQFTINGVVCRAFFLYDFPRFQSITQQQNESLVTENLNSPVYQLLDDVTSSIHYQILRYSIMLEKYKYIY